MELFYFGVRTCALAPVDVTPILLRCEKTIGITRCFQPRESAPRICEASLELASVFSQILGSYYRCAPISLMLESSAMSTKLACVVGDRAIP